MRVVETGQLHVLAGDVTPHVQLGPVTDREHPDVLARSMPAVVQAPQLGTLLLRIPLAEGIAQAEDSLLGARTLLVAAPATQHRVELVVGDGLEQRNRLQGIADSVRALGQTAVGQVILDVRDHQAQVVALDDLVAEGQHLGEVVPGVDVQQRKKAGVPAKRP